MVSVVDVSSGLVSDRQADATSLDVPADLGGVPEATLDGVGLLHFEGADGRRTIASPHLLPLAMRVAGEEFLVRGPAVERDANGWEVYRRCVREPASPTPRT